MSQDMWWVNPLYLGAVKPYEGATKVVEVTVLGAKLDDMQLYDDTGDPRDEGYMAAIKELREWIESSDGRTREPLS